ncbi:2-hydroxy-3-oxopropionate reductase [Candidatus Bathyarchaeota archaeon]|nr:MAG: 2-hydroxy-3-oxopropionate reductase [Candidatus Bathyarchaeota archaeon]
MEFVKRVGFIGLGLMGSGMSMNLLKAGFPLTVWNRTRSKMKPLLDAGAEGAGSPREVAERSDVVIDIVTDSPDVEEVLLGPEGVIHGAKPGTIVIDMSTISPAVTRRIAAELAKKDIRMLDAPVSGGAIGARNRTLSIMVGGDAETFQECLPIFQAMGKTITHVGGHGMGQTVKLCNQILVGLNMLAVAEALMFASKAGVDLEKAYAAVSGGAAGSWQLTNNGARLLKGDLEPGFKVKDYLKDLRLIMETAAEIKMPLVGTSVVHQMFRSLDAEGLREKGTQAVIRAVEKLAEAKLLK